MDSVAYVNSHTGSLAEAHIALLNTSASTQSYLIKRMQIGTTGLVDSNYFCWDLCYPTWVNQSQGSVQVNAGAVAYDFSGYAYVMFTPSPRRLAKRRHHPLPPEFIRTLVPPAV